MIRRHAIVRMLATAGLGGLLVAGAAAPALACTVSGDGAPFATIQAAVNAGAFAINFTGTDCDAFVNIFHPVQLTGTGATSANNVITQGISVFGTLRVGITKVQIGGDTSNFANSGIFITNGAYVTVRNSNLESTLQGVEVLRGSIADIRNSTIMGRAPSASNDVCNVCAVDNSMIKLQNTTITMNENNDNNGTLDIVRNSSLLMRNNGTGGGNSITNTGTLPAIEVFGNSSFRQDDIGVDSSPPVDSTPDAITGGISVGEKSLADVRDVTITGNVTVDLDSTLRIPGSAAFASEPGDVSITGNITASRASSLAFGSSATTVMGNVTCSDGSSHMSGSPTVTGTKSCTGF